MKSTFIASLSCAAKSSAHASVTAAPRLRLRCCSGVVVVSVVAAVCRTSLLKGECRRERKLLDDGSTRPRARCTATGERSRRRQRRLGNGEEPI